MSKLPVGLMQGPPWNLGSLVRAINFRANLQQANNVELECEQAASLFVVFF
jgi:hypothetical protein